MKNMPETSTQSPAPVNKRLALRRRRLVMLPIILLGCVGLVLIIVSSLGVSASQTTAQEQSLRAEFFAPELQGSGGDFSKFSHTQTHAALPCLLCHRRESSSPRPPLPGHTPCAGCHAQNFSNSSSPICTICHTDVSSGAVKPFPSLKSFNMKFDHARHMTGASRPGAGCAACHQPQRRGAALSIPAGFNAHATCFQCHAPRAQSPAGRDISSCSTCHSPGSYVRTSTQARAYAVNFSHARHAARQGMSCQNCHNIRAGMPQSSQVTAPQPLMHHASARAQSCMTCHNNKRAFGIENFGDCKRCHQATHFYF
jgi:c(7)-type cytochrome triheme protein